MKYKSYIISVEWCQRLFTQVAPYKHLLFFVFDKGPWMLEKLGKFIGMIFAKHAR
jgi:hypothetical protein